MRRSLLACAVAVALPAALSAQEVRTGVVPDSVTVGDVVHAAMRISVPPGVAVTWPDSLVLPPELENAGDRAITADTTTAGIEFTALYPIAGWRPGAHALPAVPFTVDGQTRVATFDSLRIQSVLPADTTGIEARPLKDVVGGTRVWWPWIVAAIAAVALAFAAWRYWQRRRGAVPVVALPVRPPRDVALERLERARTARMVENGDMKGFHTAVSDALRWYVSAIDPDVGQDLTTSEIAAVVRRRGATPAGVELVTLLAAADLVKFARRTPSAHEAYDEWSKARGWVATAEWPPVAHSESTVAA